MKAAVLLEANTPLVVEDVDIEGPRDDEVQVRIGATGICHSDLHNIKGEWDNQTPPGIPPLQDRRDQRGGRAVEARGGGPRRGGVPVTGH